MFGLLFSLIFLILAFSTLMGWIYLYLLTISFLIKFCKKLIGENAAMPIVLLGFPFLFGGTSLCLVKLFQGQRLGNLFVVAIMLALPALGIWAMQSGKFQR